jgi:protein-disulfide isomerase
VCAQAQGRFWPFHDRLFSNQGQLTPSDLRGHAEAVLLDLAAYDTCMADPATATRITTDIAEGVRVGLEGTPTFFVNGAKFVGGRSLEELQRIVEAQRGGGAPVSGSAK